jgi:hypothetical protein
LHKKPFDGGLKEIANRFGSLEMIDAHGLKARYLAKYKQSAMGFIGHVVSMKCVTEAALALSKRIEKNKNKNKTRTRTRTRIRCSRSSITTAYPGTTIMRSTP